MTSPAILVDVGHFGELLGAVRDGSLPLPVDGIFDLADVAGAFAAQAKPGRKGKILLRP